MRCRSSVSPSAPGELLERGVALSAEGALIDADRPATRRAGAPDRSDAASRPRAGRLDYLSELCPMLAPWIGSLAAALARGALLLIDYGSPRHEYYHPQRDSGTLALPFPAPRARRCAAISGPAGHHRLGRLHARGRSVRWTRTRRRRLLHAGGVPAGNWYRGGRGSQPTAWLRAPDWPPRHARCCCPERWVSTSRSWR